MGYDLHTHSIYSDGTLKPRELVVKAKDKGLTGIALTDHDTVGGIAEAVAAANELGYTFIPGIELTTDYGETEAHILGYGINYNSQALLKKLDQILESRNARAKEILKKLRQARINLSWEKIKAQATSKFIGRTHIYRALQDSGYISRDPNREAFNYFLGKNGLAYVPHHEINTSEAIDLINGNGGFPVLAHPGRMADDQLIRNLVGYGLKGIEIYYPSHTPEMVERYLKLAEKYQLFVTGGSDFHGAFSQNRLGEAEVASINSWYYPKISSIIS